MKTYFIYHVEGFETYETTTEMYKEVRHIEVIAKNETDALEKAKKALKAKNYCVRGCYEKISP